ncbi:OmpA family protein [Luteolibacter luteus]|uniref:OmpA family protein n=1 Tax=Luteolibacter luteus TaxID=2728835 RepID=A0A858RHP2_9BACT|nr:OmpA family protein [Luteolibacter luteus]QJE95939.1 OmpA family protein [Luteolibacter luteus]
MDHGYSWRESRDSRPLRLPGPDNMGWWVAAAFFIAVILHVAAFFALGHIKIGTGIFPSSDEISTERVSVRDVDITPTEEAVMEPEPAEKPAPDKATLLEEIDMLDKLPENTEMEIKPDLSDPEFAVRLENPAIKGNPEGIVVDPAAGFDLDTALPELGRSEDPPPIAADAQMIVDPGASIADDTNLDRFAQDLLKKGAGGVSDVGTLDGMVTLDDMVGLSADVLVGKKTMLPSDLLFEYDSAVLRESAKVGMMKLALIVERNPKLYCWIEGYSDLFGGDAYNQDLSRRRAGAVREYLVNTLHLNGDRIVPRGHGKARPLVSAGSVEEQAPNRRVEIRMRRTPPPAEKVVVTEKAQAPAPPKETPAPAPSPAPAPPPKDPVVVKPMRALPVVEDAPKAKPITKDNSRMRPLEEQSPRARPIQENPPKAQRVEEEPPKAKSVEEEEEAPRAQGVEEEPEAPPARAVPVE